jgi:uncharacterized integral membrane protein
MKKAKLVIVIVLAVIAIVLMLQNMNSVTTRILFAKVDMPQTILLLVTLAIGFVAGMIVAAGFRGPKSEK